MAIYVLCGLFGPGFVANFVAIVVALMLDFWIVRAPRSFNFPASTRAANLSTCADEEHLRPAAGRAAVVE